MNTKRLKYFWLILFLFFFLTTGCAHRRGSSSHGAQNHSPVREDRQTTTAKTEQVSPDHGRKNYSDGDKFADEFTSFEDEFKEDKVRLADPFAPWNRVMFHFNDKFYFWILKPLAQGYKTLVPRPARIGVKNFFNNLAAPVRIVNCALQGKGNPAVEELGKFLINSTVGIAGFRNVGEQYAVYDSGEEDLGQTLGAYGIGNGIYIVWPLLGPSTLRDTVGLIGDSFLNPVSYIDPWEASTGITSYKILNETSLQIGDYEAFKASAVAPYEALKDVYLQNRKKKVED